LEHAYPKKKIDMDRANMIFFFLFKENENKIGGRKE